jgi:hypothetical protein
MLPDRPAESQTVGVVRRPERVARGAVRDTHGLTGSRAGGSWFAGSLAVQSVAEAPGLGAGVHEGNAGLHYRSVLAREVSREEVELYRDPRRRGSSRRGLWGAGRAEGV